MKAGDFAIFRGIPVAIKSIEGDDVEIKHCLRLLDDEDRALFETVLEKFQTKVKLSKLKEFNTDSVKELTDSFDRQISAINIVKHAIDDCLSYI